MQDLELLKSLRTLLKKGEVEGFFNLLDSNPGAINLTTPFGTWLHEAVTWDKLDILKGLLSRGLDVNIKSGIAGGNVLNEASRNGDIETIKFLLDNHANMDTDEPVYNPLFTAIQNGHFHIVKLLVESGINTDIKYTGDSMKNMGALDYAKEQGQLEIVDYLNSLQNRGI